MKNVALTMRADFFGKYNEERNSIDPRWYEFLRQFKCRIILIPNDLFLVKSILNFYKIDLIILSGGGNPLKPENVGDKKRLDIEKFLLEQSILLTIPVIGICRGAQSIICYQGGDLIPSSLHVNTKHKVYFEFKNSFNITVNSFHNFVIDSENLPPDFYCFAFDVDKNIEGMVHNFFPWMGIMWHPERNFHKIDKLLFETALEISDINNTLKAELLKNIKQWIN